MTRPDDLAPLRSFAVGAVRDLALIVMIFGASAVAVSVGAAIAMWWAI